MNENDIAKIIKKMPEDLVAESAKFADNGVQTAQPSRKRTRGEFFRHPAFSIAVSAVLVVVCAAAAVGIVLKKRVNTNEPGRDDPVVAGTGNNTPGPETAEPEATPEAPVLIDVSGLIGEDQLGLGRLFSRSSGSKDDLFDAFLAAYENGENGPKYDWNYVLNDELIDRITEFRNEAFLRSEYDEVTPREIEGTARLFRCESSKPEKTYSTLMFGDKLVFVPEAIGQLIPGAVAYDYDNNGVNDLLLRVFSKVREDGSRRASINVYDVVQHKFIEVCAFYTSAEATTTPEILQSGQHVYVTDRDIQSGGELVYANGAFTIGGVPPMTFIRALFGDGYLGAAEPYIAADPSATAGPATPGPGTAQPTAELVDFSGAVNGELHGNTYNFGFTRINDKPDLTAFMEKWHAYVEAYLRSASELPGGPAEEVQDYCDKLRLSETASEAFWMDISPEGTGGFGQLIRCEYVHSADSEHASFTLDVLYADGDIRYVFSDPDRERLVARVVPLHIDGSETPGLLAVSSASLENSNMEFVVYVYDPNSRQVTAFTPSVPRNQGIYLVSTDGTAYVYYSKNALGGKVEFDGTVLTIGGVAPAEFFRTVFNAAAKGYIPD